MLPITTGTAVPPAPKNSEPGREIIRSHFLIPTSRSLARCLNGGQPVQVPSKTLVRNPLTAAGRTPFGRLDSHVAEAPGAPRSRVAARRSDRPRTDAGDLLGQTFKCGTVAVEQPIPAESTVDPSRRRCRPPRPPPTTFYAEWVIVALGVIDAVVYRIRFLRNRSNRRQNGNGAYRDGCRVRSLGRSWGGPSSRCQAIVPEQHGL